MKILIDITHPAHVHFFKNPINQLYKNGHDLLVTSRVKEITHDLLEGLDINHKSLSYQPTDKVIYLLKELIIRDLNLYRVTKEFKPDVMVAIGGIFISHVGLLTNTPSLVFYDTENAVIQNMLTYPFASKVIVPRCYNGRVPANRTMKYNGYHELSYLHPNYFTPNKDVAIKNGLSPENDTFIIRLVSWKANHDLGESGWSIELLKTIICRLNELGKIIISSESELPSEFSKYIYRGNPKDIHHVMAYCRAFIGESATMASESAVLGVPAIYAANTGRGYTDEQESRYNLVRNVKILDNDCINKAIEWAVNYSPKDAQDARYKLLNEMIDVAEFVTSVIENFARVD